MAEGLARKRGLEAVSCGLEPGETDEMMIAVMREVGVDMSAHEPQSLQSVASQSFSKIIAFTEDSFAAVQSVFGDDAQVELWSIPMSNTGSYDVRAIMDSYRTIRTIIATRLDRLR
jgi:protein-tyrosine-phosphatase